MKKTKKTQNPDFFGFSGKIPDPVWHFLLKTGDFGMSNYLIYDANGSKNLAFRHTKIYVFDEKVPSKNGSSAVDLKTTTRKRAK